MRVLLAIFIGSVLGACASAPPPAPPPSSLFDDASFGAPSEPARADDVFTLDAAMRSYLATEIQPELRRIGRPQGLIDALYSRKKLKLAYDSSRTRNAAEAFEGRAGNCLSLVLMTAAFAKELGFQLRYQSADREETWSRSGDLLLRAGHVNVIVAASPVDLVDRDHSGALLVDFLPGTDLVGMRTHEIPERTVIAMYLNNRAVEQLLDARLDDAYAWARAAIEQDAGFLSSYITLGVVYLRHGDPARAETAMTHVLDADPDNTRALSNLAEIFDAERRPANAAATRARLAKVEVHPPFYFFEIGLAAMQRGDYRIARDLFAREVARADYDHELHFWLALAEWRLGETAQAMHQLQLAREDSTTDHERQLYTAKLDWLMAHRRP